LRSTEEGPNWDFHLWYKIGSRSLKLLKGLGKPSLQTGSAQAWFLFKVFIQIFNPIPSGLHPYRLIEHDFFSPQPVLDAAVYVLRRILHDWPDSLARRILRHLRDVAAPFTQLLVIDHILPLACPPEKITDVEERHYIVEGAQETPPGPLLPNMGKASSFSYSADMCVRPITI
jgi:hypothetical protein